MELARLALHHIQVAWFAHEPRRRVTPIEVRVVHGVLLGSVRLQRAVVGQTADGWVRLRPRRILLPDFAVDLVLVKKRSFSNSFKKIC